MKLGVYFLRKACNEKKNIASSILVYLFLFASLQATLGLTVKATKSIYFFSPGFRDGCYYSTSNTVSWDCNIPESDQGFVWEVSTFEKDNKLIYKARGTLACANENLGYLVSSYVYLLPQEHDFTEYPKSAPFSITYNIDNPELAYQDSSGAFYPLLGKGRLLVNASLQERVESMNLSGYGLVVMIDDSKEPDGPGKAVVRGHGDSLSLNSFRSGKNLNQEYAFGRRQIPTAFYAGFLLPFLFEVIIAFGIISALNEKGSSEIRSLRLIGAKRSQCFFFFFLTQLCEFLCAFIAVFSVAFPILHNLFSEFAFILGIAEILIFVYAILCVLIVSKRGCHLIFSSKERKKRNARN